MSRVLKGCLLSLAAVVLLSGCAVGNKHSYHDAMVLFDVEAASMVAVAAQDRRPYVLSGAKTPDFVGLQRGGFGNPFDVTTQSGKPLSTDFTESVVRSLVQGGAKAVPISIAPSLNRERAIAELRRSGAEKLLLLQLNEWKSDTFNNTALIYDVKAYVCDSTGEIIAESEISGRENLGGSAFNPPGHAKAAVPQAFKRKLEELLGARQVAAALK